MIKKLLLSAMTVGLSLTISCNQSNSEVCKNIKWRAKTIRKNKLVYAFNIDSLPVKAGDTVLLNYNSDGLGYYIANVAFLVRDTAYLDSFVDSNGVEQTYHYEAVNVVLLDNNVR
ncbi:MAG: hypothetical protein ACKOX3_01835 [Bacteroidota bacterium]